jgi:periplasmic copper chaperone A
MTSQARSFAPANGPAKAGLGLATVAAGVLFGAAAALAAGSITVENPWLRLVIKARPAAGYFTLHNNTDAAVALTGAASSACGMMMLHQTKEVNGVEKMLPVKSISVPARGTFRFSPGGYHIMCMSPKAAMTVGAKVPVTLKFADGKKVTVSFPVKGVGGK